jgi:putative peptidoglycan lipid II flippase
LIPFSVLFVMQRVFYSLEDTRTPFFIQLVQAVLFTGCALVVATLPSSSIAVGLAVSLTIAGTVQALLTAILLRRRIGGLGGLSVFTQAAWFAIATVPATAVGLAILFALGGFGAGAFPVSPFGSVVSMAIAGGAMAVVYLGVLVIVRNDQVVSTLTPMLARIRRGR